MPKYIPTKRCDRLDKHELHEWKEGAFRRSCPGRSSTKAPSRSRREGHARNNAKKS